MNNRAIYKKAEGDNMAGKLFHKKSKRQSQSRLKKTVFFAFTLFIAALTVFIAAFEKQLLPTILEISKLRATDRINSVISKTLDELIVNQNLQSSDFYSTSVDQNGKIQTLEVNVILVDSLCAKIAERISGELASATEQGIDVPIGALFGISTLANYGPPYSVVIKPLGTAVVDYASEFESAGINQINFQIWLDVSSKLKIVNPIQNSEITVERKILLVNTVFSGEVPSLYFDK